MGTAHLLQGVGTAQAAVGLAVGGVAGFEGGEAIVPLAILGEGDAQLVLAIGGFFVVVEFGPVPGGGVGGTAVGGGGLPKVGGVLVEAKAVVEGSAEGSLNPHVAVGAGDRDRSSLF